jgi:NADH-quinone oxidoreductase subunit C
MDVVTNEYLLQRIQEEFHDAILSAELPYNMLTLVVDSTKILDILTWLKEDDILKFRFLTDICGSHFPDYKDHELCVIYHVQSMENNMRLRLKCFVPVNKPEISSVTSLYSSANWMERETYDYYGFIFTGHPNLKRILNVDEMDYFPLRKEFPLEDATRTDKEDKYFGR